MSPPRFERAIRRWLCSPQGLRTLVVAGKSLEEDDWAAWDARYQQAAADLEHRDELVRWRSVRG
jgi:hypothetical protein